MNKIGRFAAAATALGALTFAGTGTASAADNWTVTTCQGMSPFIADFPYSGQVVGGQYQSPGRANYTIHAGGSAWGGYDTQVTLNWTNLTTGASGSETQRGSVGFVIGNGSTMYFSPFTGAGAVRTDFTVVNSGLVPQTVNCSGVSQVA
ncbi:hypothetical protein [Nocardia sp. NPDC002869]|uniref:hypothetical protein n=1 Tax=Nocardia sp. NPDC002869 TaxID=3161032 RepID=UPI00398D1BEF